MGKSVNKPVDTVKNFGETGKYPAVSQFPESAALHIFLNIVSRAGRNNLPPSP